MCRCLFVLGRWLWECVCVGGGGGWGTSIHRPGSAGTPGLLPSSILGSLQRCPAGGLRGIAPAARGSGTQCTCRLRLSFLIIAISVTMTAAQPPREAQEARGFGRKGEGTDRGVPAGLKKKKCALTSGLLLIWSQLPLLLEAEVPTWTQTAPTPAPRQRGASSCLWESLHLTSVWTLTEGPLENGGNFHFLSPSPQPGEASPPRVLLAGSSAKRRPGTWIQAVNRSAENTLCLLFPEKSPCGQHVLGGTSQGPSPVSKYGEKVSAGAWKRSPRPPAGE